MKIKKVNELIASEYSEEQLKDYRHRHFSEYDAEYHIFGENLEYTVPEYTKLTTLYSIQDCIDWYNNEIKNKISRVNKFNNILFVKETRKIKILDFELLKNVNKYNI